MIDITTLRAAASRANGALSHGPVTAEGKHRSSQNALKHGLYAKTTVLWYESQEEFDHFLQAFLDHYQPRTQAEAILVEREAASLWRQSRLDRAEGLVLKDLYNEAFRTLNLLKNADPDDDGDDDEYDDDYDDDEDTAEEDAGEEDTESDRPQPIPPSHDDTLARAWRHFAETDFSQYLRRERQEIERAHRRFHEQIAEARTHHGPGFVSQPHQTT